MGAGSALAPSKLIFNHGSGMLGTLWPLGLQCRAASQPRLPMLRDTGVGTAGRSSTGDCWLLFILDHARHWPVPVGLVTGESRQVLSMPARSLSVHLPDSTVLLNAGLGHSSCHIPAGTELGCTNYCSHGSSARGAAGIQWTPRTCRPTVCWLHVGGRPPESVPKALTV